jgi:enoyl-CoA hydratase/carnithine racemase
MSSASLVSGSSGSSMLEDRPAEGVLRWTFHQPSRRNALNRAAWAHLRARLDSLHRFNDPSVACLLLDGTDPAFCAGGDITEYEWLADHPDEAATYLDVYVSAMRSLRTLPIPTVACIDGPAIGAGLALATGCDARIASERAAFGVTAIKRGLVYPIEEIARFAALAGAGIAREVVLRGVVLNSTDALRCGLVSTLVPTESVRSEAVSVATALVRSAGPVYTATKQLFARVEAAQAQECNETREIALAAFGADAFRAGAQDFLGKRP